ncbi:MAG: TIGR02584 family CRISPR-associated protein [Ignavibacteriaceae bacterium]|nr:TIGR02584 family CRISPR-associated protein [Ignavibacteriaceae bacterium]
MKNILIAVTGLTPQIVTETFFCLAKLKKVNIDEIYVITTKLGREVILGKYKNSSAYKLPLKAEIKNMCAKWKLPVPKFEVSSNVIVAQEESLELNDIRSDKDNLLFPNKTAEFIRKMSEDPGNVLYCSISGGRKSMGVHLAAALQIFGRENDKLLHVLTSEKNEFKGFYPMNTKEARELELSEIPFVSLRPLLIDAISDKSFVNLKFTEVVALSRAKLKELSEKNFLLIDLQRCRLVYDNIEEKLERVEMGIYYLIYELKTEGQLSLTREYLESREFANRLKLFLEETYRRYFDEGYKNAWFNKGFEIADLRPKFSNIKKKICKLFTTKELASQFYVTDVINVYGSKAYGIKAGVGRFRVNPAAHNQ